MSVFGCSAFGLKDSVTNPESGCLAADFFLADVVLPRNPLGAILTGREAEEERIHSGMPWPPEAWVSLEGYLRRVPVSCAWKALVDAGDRPVRWKIDGGVSFPIARILASHITAVLKNTHASGKAGDSIIVAIPDELDEFGQESLLRELKSKGFGNVQLLWRPIAAAMAWIDAQGEKLADKLEDGDVLAVIYSGPDGFEFVGFELRLRVFEGRRYALPLRDRPMSSLSLAGIDWAAGMIETVFPNIDTGAFWQAFTGFPEVWLAMAQIPWSDNDLQRIWSQGNQWRYWNPGLDMLDRIWGVQVKRSSILSGLTEKSISVLPATYHGDTGIAWDQMLYEQLDRLLRKKPKSRILGVVFCGALTPKTLPSWVKMAGDTLQQRGCKISPPYDLPKIHGIWMPGDGADAIAKGAAVYGTRLEMGKPTYLDTLPSYGLWAEIRRLGYEPLWDFYPLIPDKTEVEGGKEFSLPEPIDTLLIKAGSREFPMILKRGGDHACRQIKTSLPKPLDADCKVLVQATMKPATGFAVVTVESTDGSEVFKRGSKVKLNWDYMTEAARPEQPELKSSYGYPFVAAGRGRIHSKKEKRLDLKRFLDQVPPTGILSTQQIYFLKNKENHFLIPWGWDRFDPESFDIGLFGPVREDDPEVEEVAEKLGETLFKTFESVRKHRVELCRLMGFMYAYAPPGFVSFLMKIYQQGQVNHHNLLYAAGRVFSTSSSLETLVDRFNADPSYPENNTAQFFWAIMRSLCYYPETALLPPEKEYGVFERIYQFFCDHGRNGGNQDALKYGLCTVLFGLRLREVNTTFLNPEDPLRNKLSSVIKRMRNIGFPPTMFRGTGVRPGPGDNLNRFVLRFLNHMDTQEDRRVAGGLAAGG